MNQKDGKRCLICAGGAADEEFCRSFIAGRHYDGIYAADAGLELLASLQIMPDRIIGDLDTVQSGLVKSYAVRGTPMDIHKPQKNETDMELALQDALDDGFYQIDVLGALGGRLDHELANIQLLLLYQRKGAAVELYDAQNRIAMAHPGQRFFRQGQYGRYVSFIPLSDQVKGLTLTGFRYPLQDKDLEKGASLCISNEIAGEEATVDYRSGDLLVIWSRDIKKK